MRKSVLMTLFVSSIVLCAQAFAADGPSDARAEGPRNGAHGSALGGTCSFAYGIQKVGPVEARTGQPTKYTILVSNLGNCDLTDVRVRDLAPEGTTVTGTSGAPASVSGRRVTFSPVSIEEGDIAVFTVTVVPGPEEAGETITDNASAFTPNVGIEIFAQASSFVRRNHTGSIEE